MIIERRRYSILRGEMDRMHHRMTTMLLPLFKKHAIPSPIAIWEDRDIGSILTWMIEWPSFNARQARWANFYPHFYAAHAQEEGGEFVTRTDLTLVAPWPDRRFAFPDSEAACETAWHPQPLIGHGAAFRGAMSGPEAEIFLRAGAIAVNACDIMFGPLPMAMVILSWPDADARRDGMALLSRASAPVAMAASLGLGEGALPTAGLWESFDRMRYLPTWRLG